MELEPACHHAAEIYQESAVGQGVDRLWQQRTNIAVACKLLSRDGDILRVIYCCRAPTLLHACVVPLAAELHRPPTTDVAVGAGRGIPGAVGFEYFVYQSAFTVGDALPHRSLHRSWGTVYAAPALPYPEEQLIVAFVQIRRDVVFHPQRPFVELRHCGLHHIVAHLGAVDIHLVVAQ